MISEISGSTFLPLDHATTYTSLCGLARSL